MTKTGGAMWSLSLGILPVCSLFNGAVGLVMSSWGPAFEDQFGDEQLEVSEEQLGLMMSSWGPVRGSWGL